MTRRTFNFVLSIFGFLIFLNVLAWTAVYELSQPRFLEVIFFDVGQGDAIFVVTPQRHQILIDGGPGSVILEKLGREMPFWDRTIDLIILTHPNYDHLTGLIEVLRRYRVKNILCTGAVKDTAVFREWQKLLSEGDAEIFIAQAGQRILWESDSNNFIKILYPFERLEGQVFGDANSTSIVARLIFGQNSLLFTGDIYQSAERKLIRRGTEINSDILKVAHHGSRTSSAEEFIKKVSPEIAVIQVGRNNRYGHPHPEILERLARYDILILRTDQYGDIRIISDGANLSYEISNI